MKLQSHITQDIARNSGISDLPANRCDLGGSPSHRGAIPYGFAGRFHDFSCPAPATAVSFVNAELSIERPSALTQGRLKHLATNFNISLSPLNAAGLTRCLQKELI